MRTCHPFDRQVPPPVHAHGFTIVFFNFRSRPRARVCVRDHLDIFRSIPKFVVKKWMRIRACAYDHLEHAACAAYAYIYTYMSRYINVAEQIYKYKYKYICEVV
jgi:hypothetical protein